MGETVNNLFNFRGRSTRSEYWGVHILALIALFFVVFLTTIVSGGQPSVLDAVIILASTIAYAWVILAVSVKRCREAGINPFWTAAMFIPYAGFIVFVVVGCLKSVEVKTSS